MSTQQQARTDAVTRWRAASEAGDVDALMHTLTPDADLVSPLSGRMVFRGQGDLRVLLTAVYSNLRGLHWDTEIGDDRTRLLVGRTRIGPLRLDDAMVFELAPDGRIRRIRPHLRPWLAVTLFALMLGPKLARHPTVIRRALARSS